MKPTYTILATLVLLLTSCAPKADYDIRGIWQYTLTDNSGNTYDTGIITFSGKPTEGTQIQNNIYLIEYEGTYSVHGNSVTITFGDEESMTGTFTSENEMSGTWEGSDGVTGTWTAVRVPNSYPALPPKENAG
ncbi:MAG: hypothetical protein JXA13_17585 [Anaerolineales bacterium]|nr:hypothetical protein [Anaerolineales bacterium]